MRGVISYGRSVDYLPACLPAHPAACLACPPSFPISMLPNQKYFATRDLICLLQRIALLKVKNSPSMWHSDSDILEIGLLFLLNRIGNWQKLLLSENCFPYCVRKITYNILTDNRHLLVDNTSNTSKRRTKDKKNIFVSFYSLKFVIPRLCRFTIC